MACCGLRRLRKAAGSTPPSLARALVAAIEAWSADHLCLRSIVLFGSVARGQATPESDIDVIVVLDAPPRSLRDRRNILLAPWETVRRERQLDPVEWNLVVKSADEATAHSPLYLDVVEDGVLLVDRGNFMAGVLDGMRARMRELGSRRIFLDDGSWYWDLKPDHRWGDIVHL